MSEEERALEFLFSNRGRYIVGQALQKAIEVMEKEPEEKREYSNIADMKYLRDNLFYWFFEMEKVMEKPKVKQMIENMKGMPVSNADIIKIKKRKGVKKSENTKKI